MALATVYTDAVIVEEQPTTSAPCEARLVCFGKGDSAIILQYVKTHVIARTNYYLMTEAAAIAGAAALLLMRKKKGGAA